MLIDIYDKKERKKVEAKDLQFLHKVFQAEIFVNRAHEFLSKSQVQLQSSEFIIGIFKVP